MPEAGRARCGSVCLECVVCFRALHVWRVRGGRAVGADACWSWIVGRDDVACVSRLSVCLAHLVSFELLPSACLGVAEVLPVMVPMLLRWMRV